MGSINFTEQEVLNQVLDTTAGALKTTATLVTGDIELGAVEIKDGTTDARATVNAANTARTTATVVQAVQQVSAAGAVDTLTTVSTVTNLSQLGGAAVPIGAGTEAAAIRVTLPTDGTGKVTAVSGTAANMKVEATIAATQTLATVTTVGTLTGGGVAANAADSGNPLKVGGKYTLAGVTLDDGDRGDIALDSKSNLNSNLNTLIAGEDQTNDLLKVENRYSYAYCVADTAVKASAGFVHSLTFSPLDAAATAGTIFLYDQTSEAVPTVFSYYIPAAALVPVTVILDVVCTTGIYIGFTTVADVACTVAYR